MVIDPNKTFPEVEKMLYKLAWNAANKSFPFEEAQSEVFWGFMEACRLYCPDRGMKFSSWVFFKVSNHLRTHLHRKIEKQPPLIYMEEIKDDLLKANSARRPVREVLEAREDLSEDAKEMLLVFLDPPPEIQTLKFSWDKIEPLTPGEYLKQVKLYLGYTEGKDDTYCEIVLHEIRCCLESKKLCL